MSFAHRGENGSHVYVFESERGYECSNCPLMFQAPNAINPKITTQVPDTGHHFVTMDNFDMIRHLADHMKDGHTVTHDAVWELARAHFDDGVG